MDPNISFYIEGSQKNYRSYRRVGIRTSCQFFFIYSQSFSVTSSWMAKRSTAQSGKHVVNLIQHT